MKSWIKKFVVVSSALAISVAVVTPSLARPGDADTQMQVEIDQYTAKIKANPRDFDSILQRGILYRRLKRLGLCKADAYQLISLDSKNASGYWLLSRVAKDESDYEGGLKWIRECIKREQPDLNHLYYELGTLTDLKRDSEVIERSIQIEKSFPKDGRNFYYRALARLNLGQPKPKVLADLSAAKKLGYNDPKLMDSVEETEKRLRK